MQGSGPGQQWAEPPVAEMVSAIATGLLRRGWRLAVAESCTGGLIGHELTQHPGISRVFVGGVTAYHNAVKAGLLGVSGAQLAASGAVSGAVARQMARGVARLLRAECTVAVSGIAGPAGGTPRKPVGTVWIAWYWPGGGREGRFQFAGSRASIKRQAAEAALRGLWQLLGETA